MYKHPLIILIALAALTSCKQEKLTPIETKSYFESYRVYLWNDLVLNGWNVDFVGTRQDNFRYPGVNNLIFDRDHEGQSGIQTDEVLENIDLVMLITENPDVVLLCIGGNDLVNDKSIQNTIGNIGKIIDKIQKYNPRATVFLEQIAPPKKGAFYAKINMNVVAFNSAITILSTQKTNSFSKVVAIDMYTDWRDAYMADDVHYNVLGAKEVANRYFNSINMHLNRNKAFTLLTLGDSRVEGRRPTRSHNGFNN